MQARVMANNSSPVKFRQKPGGLVIRTIAQGTIVEVIKKYDETWSQIEVNGEQGYMMTKFLIPISNSSTLQELKEELKKVLALLDNLEKE